jgi:orotidine-5'-phosphate decarboxylase
MDRIIGADRSIIVAADVTSDDQLYTLAEGTSGIAGIGAYKLGLGAGLNGLRSAVLMVKDRHGAIPIIYDHQKGGNDIPDMGLVFAQKMKQAGIDAAIPFPFTGPATQEMWIKSLQDAGIVPIVGGIMTHKKFLVSEGGYIFDDAPQRIYHLGCKLGVQHFVVPGNKMAWVEKIRGWLVEILGEGNFVLYAPGFITQEGSISDCGLVAGKYWHAIMGSGIYGKDKFNPVEVIRERAQFYSNQILSLAA